jgi:hypothetical protein
MVRGNGGIIGRLRRYPSTGVWSIREAQLKTVSIDYAIVGGGNSQGKGGSLAYGSTLIQRTTQAVTVGAINGASLFLGITAAAGLSGAAATQSAGPTSFNTYAYTSSGQPGGGPAFNAGTGGSCDLISAYGGSGGAGNLWPINGQYYGAGIKGYRSTGGLNNYGEDPWRGSEGANGLGFGNYGTGNMAGGVIISYVSGVYLFTGGTRTIVSGRVYHSFSSSGFLIPA